MCNNILHSLATATFIYFENLENFFDKFYSVAILYVIFGKFKF